MTYLLDTDICVNFLRKNKKIVDKVREIQKINIAISIITVAELQFGAWNSSKIAENTMQVDGFRKLFTNIALTPEITEMFAKQKSHLRKLGTPIDDFDILIGSTAIVDSLILVTNNEQHFCRLEGLSIENWLSEESNKS